MTPEIYEIHNQTIYARLVTRILGALAEDHPGRVEIEPLILDADESTDFGALLTRLDRLIVAHRENVLLLPQ
ncbi:MAG: hypothetical protein P4L91_07605 [Burkholderiaceae bacterium]|nr:hypothetical protein [Burkholderiaceae bacterium]